MAIEMTDSVIIEVQIRTFCRPYEMANAISDFQRIDPSFGVD